jgi:hypothetical protein
MRARERDVALPPPDGGGRLKWLRVGVLVGGVTLSSMVRAQNFPLGDSGLSPQAAAALGVAAGPSPDAGLPIGPFLAYPQLTLGGVYNDNLYPAATRRQAGFGLRAAPGLSALDDEGLHKISIYFNAEAELFPGANVPASMKTPISLSAGASESWTPTPDLAFAAGASFWRQNSLMQPAAIGTGFVAGPSVLNLTPSNPFLDHAEADLSAQRDLGGGFFVRAGGRVEDIVYEDAPSTGTDGGQSIWPRCAPAIN